MKVKTPYLITAVWLLILLAALVGWQFLPVLVAGSSPNNPCDPNRSIRVSGSAVVYTMPDLATIQLGLESNGLTPDAVQSENFTRVQKVISSIRGLGVEEKDIATDYYLVYPLYDGNDVLSIKGYRIDNTISVTLRDVSIVEKVISLALKNGANEIKDVQFYSTELRKYRDQARDLAVNAAAEKANALAQASGAQTGCVMQIEENTWSQYYGSWQSSRQTAPWAQNVIQNVSSNEMSSTANADAPIKAGQMAVRAEIDVTYSLK